MILVKLKFAILDEKLFWYLDDLQFRCIYLGLSVRVRVLGVTMQGVSWIVFNGSTNIIYIKVLHLRPENPE